MLCYKKVKYHMIFLMDPTPRRVYPTLWGSRRWEAHQGSAAVRAATTQPQPCVLCWALRRAQEGGSRHAAAIDLCIMATKQPLSLLWCALVRELPEGGSMSLCISAFHSSSDPCILVILSFAITLVWDLHFQEAQDWNFRGGKYA